MEFFQLHRICGNLLIKIGCTAWMIPFLAQISHLHPEILFKRHQFDSRHVICVTWKVDISLNADVMKEGILTL